jgi:CPA1 family monovalent cation:H+ antiporter
LLTLCFGVVAFSIVVQGLTMKPLLNWLGIVEEVNNAYSMQKAKQLILGASNAELENLKSMRAISPSVFSTLSKNMEDRAMELESGVRQIQELNPELVEEEIRQARLRLLAAERSALQRAVIEGIVKQEISEHILAESAKESDRLVRSSHSSSVSSE